MNAASAAFLAAHGVDVEADRRRRAAMRTFCRFCGASSGEQCRAASGPTAPHADRVKQGLEVEALAAHHAARRAAKVCPHGVAWHTICQPCDRPEAS